MNYGRKLGLLAAALVIASGAFALRSGDDAAELKGVNILTNGPFPVTPAKVDAARARQLKIIVLLRDENGAVALSSLLDLARLYPESRFAAVYCGPALMARELFGAFDTGRLTTGYDADMEFTRRYMGPNGIFPRAYVVDYRGKIIWDGEAVDLGEMLAAFHAGNFDAARQEKIAPLLEELQSRLRSGEDAAADRAAKQVLALDPANMAALRMRVFMLEATNRVEAARVLIDGQLAKAPRAERLYIQMLDFVGRHQQYAGDIGKIAARYMEHVKPDAGSDATLVWMILNHRPYDAAVLNIAGLLVERSVSAIAGTGDHPAAADVYSSAALYSYRIGRLAAAVDYQRRAGDLLEKIAPHRASSSREMGRFYRAALELGGQ